MGENKEVIAANARQTTALVESWPNLMFLGLGIWWAWIWLSFSGTRLTEFFSEDCQSQYVLVMYLTSTLALIASLLMGAAFWRKLTQLLDKRSVAIGFGVLASLATVGVCVGGRVDSFALFCVASCFTGVGTSALCLKAGRIYGSVSLGESLTAGSISLLFAALLYFVGIGIPHEWSLVYIAALPLCSAAMLSLPWADPFPAAVHGSNEKLPLAAPERRMLLKIAAAACVVAFTAGVAKGIGSITYGPVRFSQSAVCAIFFIGVVAIVIILLINRARSAHGIRMVYTLLMVAGIFEMLCTCFGFDIFYLEVGKSALVLFTWCFMAYLVFKYDFSAVRTFGAVQATYYVCSLLGWLVGGAIGGQYMADQTVRMGVGAALAALVVVVLLFVLTEEDVRNIVTRSYEGAPASAPGAAGTGMPVSVELAPGVGGGEEAVPSVVENLGALLGSSAAAVDAAQSDAPVDLLQRARDPKYGLSNRELEILEPFAQGRSANWIADHFVISKNTVRTHLRNIYSKLAVHTRQELLDFLAQR